MGKEIVITNQQIEDKIQSTEGYEGVTLEALRERQKKYSERNKGKVMPMTDAEKEYWEKLKKREKQQSDFSLESLVMAASQQQVNYGRKFEAYPIPLADAKKLFQHIYEARILQRKDAVVYDEFNKPVIENLVKYFIGDKTGVYNLNKGIYLWGNVGRGKSELFPCFQQFVNIIEQKLTAADKKFTSRKFQIESCKSIVLKVAETKNTSTLKRLYTGCWCLDDVGAEDNYKLFGNDLNVILDIVIERHKKLQDTGLLTHATSNMPPKEKYLIEKYDARFESRCNEMFNFVHLGGDDKRKI